MNADQAWFTTGWVACDSRCVPRINTVARTRQQAIDAARLCAPARVPLSQAWAWLYRRGWRIERAQVQVKPAALAELTAQSETKEK